MPDVVPLEVVPSTYRGLIGIARRDATPPDGIYAQCVAEGRRLFADDA